METVTRDPWLDMTTVAHGYFHRQDFHLLDKRASSLHTPRKLLCRSDAGYGRSGDPIGCAAGMIPRCEPDRLANGFKLDFGNPVALAPAQAGLFILALEA
jgi:hypothetical protein